GVGVDQCLFAFVPLREQGRRWGRAGKARVLDPGVLHPGDVPRGAGLSAEVPDGLIGIGVVVGEETATVDLREDPGVSPSLAAVVALGLGYRSHIDDVDDQ